MCDQEKLRAAAEHVTYEITMLFHSASRCLAWEGQIEEDRNLALECFLLHYRNLRDFLCPNERTTREDDVTAADFLGWPHTKRVGDAKALGVDNKARLDKRLAHLSYARDQLQPGWAIVEMLSKMTAELNTFLVRINPSRRVWFPQIQTKRDGWALQVPQADGDTSVDRSAD